MSSKHLVILPAVAALLLSTACSNDDNNSLFAEGLVAAQVKADISDGQTVTRVNSSGDAASFTAGDEIHVVANGKETYDYIKQDDGTWKAETNPYYFQDHEDVTFRGWYAAPEATVEDNTISINTATQTTNNDDWNLWDILVTPEVTANVSSPTVDFTVADNKAFEHIMSQVSFTFTAGDGVSNLSTLTGYTLKSVTTEASFNTLSCELKEVSGTGDITQTVSNVTATTTTVDCDPIILVPQEVTDNLLLEVSFNSQTYYAELALPSESEGALQAGIHYAFSVTIDNTGLKVNSVEIKNWATPTTDIADAWLSRPNSDTIHVNGVVTFIVYNEAGLLEWYEYTAGVTDGTVHWDTNCTVAADFHMTKEWTAVNTSNVSAYTGTFDGQGYTIYDLKISGSGTYQSLIGYLNDGGVVENLTLANVDITSESTGSYAAPVVGYVGTGGTVSGCSVTVAGTGTSTISGAGLYTGGVVGNNRGTVIGCSSTADVTGSSTYVGGVAARNYNGDMIGCYSTGTVTNTKSTATPYTGGVTGQNSNGTIIGCYATGSVTGSKGYVGGAIGQNTGSKSEVTACYWYNDASSKGVGNGTDNTSKVDDGTVDGWASAADAMNGYLDDYTYTYTDGTTYIWQYEANSAYKDEYADTNIAPLLLEKTTSTTTE